LADCEKGFDEKVAGGLIWSFQVPCFNTCAGAREPSTGFSRHIEFDWSRDPEHDGDYQQELDCLLTIQFRREMDKALNPAIWIPAWSD
jgi:hypothetical protein